MIAAYSVKRNGKWYRAGEEIPHLTAEANGNENSGEQRTYTKSEIARMPVDELRQLAITCGVENAQSMTGNELKQHFISLLNL